MFAQIIMIKKANMLKKSHHRTFFHIRYIIIKIGIWKKYPIPQIPLDRHCHR